MKTLVGDQVDRGSTPPSGCTIGKDIAGTRKREFHIEHSLVVVSNSSLLPHDELHHPPFRFAGLVQHWVDSAELKRHFWRYHLLAGIGKFSQGACSEIT